MSHAQSRLGSLVESLVNVVIGFGVNFMANLTILPLLGFSTLTWQTNLLIGGIFTAISVVRSYVIRRWFDGPIRGLIQRAFPA